jgi:3-oxoadipate enol-lactonase
MFTRVQDLVVHHTLEGPEDAPVLLMLHSLGTSLHVWDLQAAALSRRWRVLRPDLRGHGLTTLTPGPYDMGLLARDALGLLATLGIASAHVAGLSIGGRIALEMAAHAPDRVASLLLCDTALEFPPARLWEERAAAARERGMEAIVEPVLARWVLDAGLPSSRGLREMLLRTPAEGYAAAADALRLAGAESVQGRIRCPALVLVGEQDAATPVSAAEALRAAVPGSTLRVIPSAAHIPTFEQAEAVTGALEAWLAGTA